MHHDISALDCKRKKLENLAIVLAEKADRGTYTQEKRNLRGFPELWSKLAPVRVEFLAGAAFIIGQDNTS